MNSLTQLNLSDKTFIFIMGATGAGKSQLVRDLFPDYTLIDIDKNIKESGDESTNGISNAIKKSKQDFLEMIQGDETFVQAGTGGNLLGAQNKFYQAQEKGFKVFVILVECELETLYDRVDKRTEKGDQRHVPHWKISHSKMASEFNFKILKEIADGFMTVKCSG